MKGVGLRRQQRHTGSQSTVPSNDAPVPVVFRVHSDGLSKAQFLFCPKNFNLANPSTAPSTPASASSPTSAGDTEGSRDAVETLVEAFVELRPTFPATTRSGNAGAPAGGPLGNHSFGSIASFSSMLRDGPPGSPLNITSPTSGENQPQRGLYRHPHRVLTSYSSVQDLVNAAHRVESARGTEAASPVLYTSVSEANLTNSIQAAMGNATSGSFVGGSSSNALATSSFVDLYALSTYVSSTAERLENDRYGDHHHSSAAGAGGGGGGSGGGMGKRGDAGTGGASGRGLASGGHTSGIPGRGSGRGGAACGGGGGSTDFAGDSHTGTTPLLMHPCGSWICRAMAFNERETVHANGAISVNQSLTLKCPIVNEIAKGKTMAKLVSYEEVRERFGLSHVELSFEHQYVSRSDMFLISEALRERVLYEGEELSMCGFRFKANELLQTFHAVAVSAASPTSSTQGTEGEGLASNAARAPAGKAAPRSPAIPLPSSPNSLLPKKGSNTDMHGGSPGGSGVGGVGAQQQQQQQQPPPGARRGLGKGAVGLTRSGSKEETTQGTSASTGATNIPTTADAADVAEKREIRVGCGLVTADTRINFRSLSPVYYLVVELTHEMWGTTLDGRICLTWALKKFMRELLLQQLPRRRASPLVRVIFTGRLRREFMFSGESDIFHMLEIPQDTRGVDIAEEVERHCEALVERVVREVKEEALRRLVLDDSASAWEVLSVVVPQNAAGAGASSGGGAPATPTAVPSSAFAESARTQLEARIRAIQRLTPKDVFVHAKQSNTLEALSIILEQCTHHYIDRRLHMTGHCVTVVTAGKGHYQTSNGLVQINCTRMHDLGLERVHFVCIGRPPLHATPLLEYTTEDETLRAQYHLPYGGGPRDGHQHYFEVPEWALCFFYYPILGAASGETRFELLSKADWMRRYTAASADDSSSGTGPASSLAASCATPQKATYTAMNSAAAGEPGAPRSAMLTVEDGAAAASASQCVVVGLTMADGTAGDGGGSTGVLSSVPAALINGQRVILQGLGLSTCPPPVVVLPTHYFHHNTDASGGGGGGGEANEAHLHDEALLAEARPMLRRSRTLAARSQDDGLYGDRSLDALAAPTAGRANRLTAAGASQPVPTTAIVTPTGVTARGGGVSGSPVTGSAPRTFSLPRSLEAYRRGDGPLCVSRSYDFKTTANPLLHASGSYQYSRLSSSSVSSLPHQAAVRAAVVAAAANTLHGHTESGPVSGHLTDSVPTPGGTVDDVAALSLHAAGMSSRRRRPPTTPFCLVTGTWYSLHGISASGTAGAVASSTATGVTAEAQVGRSLADRVLHYSQTRRDRAATPTSPMTTLTTNTTNTTTVGCRLPWHRAAADGIPDAAPCGLNVLDSDLKGGYLLLQLTLSPPPPAQQQQQRAANCFWSPRVLMEDRAWATLMACFSGRDDRAGRDDGGVMADTSITTTTTSLSGGGVGHHSGDVSLSASEAAPYAATPLPRTATDEVTTVGASPTSTDALPFFQSDFRPTDVFCRLYSGITADGRTLVLATHANDVTIRNPEELRFCPHPSLVTEATPDAISDDAVTALCAFFTDCDAIPVRHGQHHHNATTASTTANDAEATQSQPEAAPETAAGADGTAEDAAVPCDPLLSGGEVASALFSGPRPTVTVGYVQLRDRLLFAIKPVDPLRPSGTAPTAEGSADGEWMLPRSAANVTTETVFKRRWIYQHPEVSLEAPHIASWTRLCTCKMLPLYGIKPAYTREGFYTVPPHQYSLADTSRVAERSKTLEFVLQRLQQQYQIVDHGGLASQWPRAEPLPNMRVDMSIGHQMHTLKIGETTKTISVSRMLHRGMYSNAQVTHMLSYRYSLWNYLNDAFDVREVHMESQVGEKNAYSWEDLDRWIQNRPDSFIPHSHDTWLRAREVAVALLPDDPAKPPAFEEFHNFIGYRFSVHLSTRGRVEWVADDAPLKVSVPPLSSPEGSEYPEPPAFMEVVLTHDNPRALETRSRVDPHTGRTIAFEQPVEERFMLVDIDLHHHYNPRCSYMLKVAWLGCAASIVADWHGSFIANAARYHLRVVPIPCYYQNPRTDTLTVHYNVEVGAQEEPTVRRRLLRLLTDPTFRYYPDATVMNRNCRLVHLSGLCYVTVPPSSTIIAQWYQNALLRQGTPQQQELFRQFCYAVELAKSDAVID